MRGSGFGSGCCFLVKGRSPGKSGPPRTLREAHAVTLLRAPHDVVEEPHDERPHATSPPLDVRCRFLARPKRPARATSVIVADCQFSPAPAMGTRLSRLAPPVPSLIAARYHCATRASSNRLV